VQVQGKKGKTDRETSRGEELSTGDNPHPAREPTEDIAAQALFYL